MSTDTIRNQADLVIARRNYKRGDSSLSVRILDEDGVRHCQWVRRTPSGDWEEIDIHFVESSTHAMDEALETAHQRAVRENFDPLGPVQYKHVHHDGTVVWCTVPTD